MSTKLFSTKSLSTLNNNILINTRVQGTKYNVLIICLLKFGFNTFFQPVQFPYRTNLTINTNHFNSVEEKK